MATSIIKEHDSNASEILVTYCNGITIACTLRIRAYHVLLHRNRPFSGIPRTFNPVREKKPQSRDRRSYCDISRHKTDIAETNFSRTCGEDKNKSFAGAGCESGVLPFCCFYQLFIRFYKSATGYRSPDKVIVFKGGGANHVPDTKT